MGNLIDRMFYGMIFGYGPLFGGRVVDFFDVDFFTIDLFGYHLSRFWVFNVADASVTIGVILLMLFHRMAVSEDKPVPPSPSTEPPIASLKSPETMPQEFDIVVPAGKKKERLDVYLTNHVGKRDPHQGPDRHSCRSRSGRR